MYFGSNQQPINMLMDTGSYLTWVSSRMCVDCDDEIVLFDERKSSTFVFYNFIIDQAYGKGDIYGYLSYDQVCVLPTKCANDFSFLTVGIVNDISGVSGLIGLSPYQKEATADSFLVRMKDSGTIENKTFSFFVNLDGRAQSKMTFGGYDLESFAYRGSKPMFHSKSSGFSWDLELDQVELRA